MRKFTSIFAIIVSLYLIVSLVRSILQLWGAQGQVAEVEKVMQVELERNKILRQQLEASQSANFVEKAAREKLNMVRPDEVALILPELPKIGMKSGVLVAVEEPNWKKWLRLFE